MSNLNEAICFATQAHSGQRRKASGEAYILHPLEVAVIVSRMGGDEDVVIAALLHDVVEDCGVAIETIEERFGPRVRQLVSSETENKRHGESPADTWRIRKEESLAHLAAAGDRDVALLWLADKLSNVRSILRSWEQIGDDVWQAFNQKDKAQHQWYYQSVAAILKPYFEGTVMYTEYIQIISVIFGGKAK